MIENKTLLKTHKLKNFKPPFCPNSKCKFHTDPVGKFWSNKGSRKMKKYPYVNLRYKCKVCEKSFSYTSFRLDYRRRSNPFELIFNLSTQGMSNRAISRTLNISEHKVRDSLKVLSRQALLKMEFFSSKIEIKEPLAYDGFETFTQSQYDPNNINHLIGKNSLFVYDFSFSHMNRKGRMTNYQKVKLKKIEKKYGRYPSNQIRVKTKKILEYLTKKTKTPVVLHTDEHKSYQLVLKKDLPAHKIDHRITNSKIYRNSKNELFPVNHLDMKLRHFLKSCTRETIGFNKNEAGLMDRIILFLTCKNFMRSKFIKGRKDQKTQSPGMILGLTNKILSFKEMFSNKMTSVQIKLRDHWKEFYFRRFDCSRYNISEYLGN